MVKESHSSDGLNVFYVQTRLESLIEFRGD